MGRRPRQGRHMTWRLGSVCLLLAACPAYAVAQVPPSSSEPQAVSRGWSAIASGRPEEAVQIADQVLERRPRSHPALSLKIEAQSTAGMGQEALETYERWLTGAGKNTEDRGLLEPIAIGMLR